MELESQFKEWSKNYTSGSAGNMVPSSQSQIEVDIQGCRLYLTGRVLGKVIVVQERDSGSLKPSEAS